jgi:hypothetical protein
MILTQGICEKCNQNINIQVAQSIYNRKLVWSVSYICPHCGNQIEEDGNGYPPKNIRELILEIEGEWNLNITNIDSKAIITLMKTLRESLNLSLPEVLKIKEKIPGCIMTGTKFELDRLIQILEAKNIKASVSRK